MAIKHAVTPRPSIRRQFQESATGSTLGQLGEMIARRQHKSVAQAPDTNILGDLPFRFGRYHLLKRLGQGAMGTVYLATDTQLCRQVAIKVPHVRPGHAYGTLDRVVLDRFFHEAHAAAILRHPNLCPVYDVGQIDGVPYLTMAYIKGRPLSHYIKRDRSLSLKWSALLLRKIAIALQVAHEKGVIHRDIKPSNIMICSGREPMIMDFGLAWRLDRRDSNERLTRIGVVLGTPAYMSPEQLSGRVEDLGPRCDVYSLGVILYELITGRCPFQGPEAVVLGQVLFIEPEPPSNHRPDLDPRLEAICQKAMAKRDVDRYGTMTELAAALTVYLRCLAAPPDPSFFTTPPVPLPASNHAQPQDLGASTEGAAFRGAGQWDGRPDVRDNEGPVAVLADAGLLMSWHRWTAIVECFALRRRSRRLRDPQAFLALRKQLIATVRTRADEVHGPERDFYLWVEGLVLPWVSVRSLARQDEEILGNLLAICQLVERILRSRSKSVITGRMLAAVSFVLAAASALVCWGFVIR